MLTAHHGLALRQRFVLNQFGRVPFHFGNVVPESTVRTGADVDSSICVFNLDYTICTEPIVNFVGCDVEKHA